MRTGEVVFAPTVAAIVSLYARTAWASVVAPHHAEEDEGTSEMLERLVECLLRDDEQEVSRGATDSDGFVVVPAPLWVAATV